MTYYTVGTIVNTHGIKGEVRVVATTDFPQKRFAVGAILWAFLPQQKQPVKLTIATVRQHKQFYLLGFTDRPSINDVESLKTATLKITADELQADDLGPGEYYYHQIVGLDVVDETGQKLGTVKEILSPGANDVWVVQRAGQSDLLLPVIDQVVKKVDLDAHQITVELMEGLD